MTDTTSLVPFFDPQGVVVIGASQDPTKLGYLLATNLHRSGYNGAIHFVNLKGDTLLGKPVYKSVLDVPDPVDLAAILIPAQFVIPALRECGKRGIRAAIIGAGGFREIGPDGLALEEEMLEVARQEGIAMAEHNFTTNSRDALLLSEAAKEQGRDKFYTLHEKLFAAFFVNRKNIGDRSILRELAAESMIDEQAVELAWQDNKYQQRINANYHEARHHEIQAVPSFIFGDRKLTGVVPEHTMRSAAGELVGSYSDGQAG